MARSKNIDLDKKTLNLRAGDFEKMGEMFPDLGSSVAVRTLLSKFVDRNYKVPETEVEVDIDANL